MRGLLAFYRPDVLVTEDYKGAGSRRKSRIKQLIDAIGALGAKERVVTATFSRNEVRDCFGLIAKRRIAEAIAQNFPELEPRLPPVRNIFDAVALGMTFFHTKEKKRAA
jgi:hypothetical protein